jgi:hypothetical protein
MKRQRTTSFPLKNLKTLKKRRITYNREINSKNENDSDINESNKMDNIDFEIQQLKEQITTVKNELYELMKYNFHLQNEYIQFKNNYITFIQHISNNPAIHSFMNPVINPNNQTINNQSINNQSINNQSIDSAQTIMLDIKKNNYDYVENELQSVNLKSTSDFFYIS